MSTQHPLLPPMLAKLRAAIEDEQVHFEHPYKHTARRRAFNIPLFITIVDVSERERVNDMLDQAIDALVPELLAGFGPAEQYLAEESWVEVEWLKIRLRQLLDATHPWSRYLEPVQVPDDFGKDPEWVCEYVAMGSFELWLVPQIASPPIIAPAAKLGLFKNNGEHGLDSVAHENSQEERNR